MFWTAGDAHAGPDDDRGALIAKGGLHRQYQRFRNLLRLMATFRQQDHKLIAAESRRHNALCADEADLLCHMTQQGVARRVPKRIIHLFKTVQIGHHQRKRHAGRGQVLNLIHKGAAARQPGQHIERGELAQARLAFMAFRDIANDHPHQPLTILMPA